jgi:hypothetical protein
MTNVVAVRNEKGRTDAKNFQKNFREKREIQKNGRSETQCDAVVHSEGSFYVPKFSRFARGSSSPCRSQKPHIRCRGPRGA